MTLKKKATVALLAMACSLTAVAQTSQISQVLPIGFNISAQVQNATPEHYTLKTRYGEQIASGDVQENMRARVTAGYMMPVSRKVMVGVSAHYDYNNEHLTGLSDDDVHIDDNHHSFRGGVNAMYFTKLWNKPLMVFANAGIDMSQWGVERASGIAAALLMLKATPETQLGVGPLVILNTTSRVPFLIVATFRHVISPKWTLNLNYPFLGMYYTPSEKHSIAGGFTFDTDYYWVHPNNDMLPKTVFFRRSLLKNGVNYNYRISPSLTFNAQAGLEYTMAGGLYTANGKHLIYDMNHPYGLYAHFGISFRPGIKIKKREVIKQEETNE